MMRDRPEWIDAPVTGWTIDDLSPTGGHTFDGETWTIRLPQTMYLLTAWYMDELCEHLYITCLDPRGKTVYKMLDELEVEENLPRLNMQQYLSRIYGTLLTVSIPSRSPISMADCHINILARFAS